MLRFSNVLYWPLYAMVMAVSFVFGVMVIGAIGALIGGPRD